MSGFYFDEDENDYRFECPACLHDVEVPWSMPNPFVCENCGHEERDERS